MGWLFWEWQTNEVLFPIAYELGGTFTFALSSTGKVYGSGESNIFCGNSFEDFLSNQLASQSGAFPWVEITAQMTPVVGEELEWIYRSAYINGESE